MPDKLAEDEISRICDVYSADLNEYDTDLYNGIGIGFYEGIAFAIDQMSCPDVFALVEHPTDLIYLNKVREYLRDKYLKVEV